MNRLRVQAVVLRRWPYSESSLALRVLTAESGVVALLAKGTYRPTSASFAVLDTWALIEMEYGMPREASMGNLYRAQLLDRFDGLSLSPDRLAVAGLLGELAEIAAPDGTPSSEVFAWLTRSLQELSEGVDFTAWLPPTLMQALQLLGLTPRLETETPTSETVWFDFSSGGVLEAGSPRPESQSRRISGAMRDRLLAAGEQRPVPCGNPEEVQETLTILGDFLSFHLERPPRAWETVRRRLLPTA